MNAKGKQLLRMLFLIGFIILSILLYAQDKSADQKKEGSGKSSTRIAKTANNTKEGDSTEPFQANRTANNEKVLELRDWIAIGVLLVTLASLLFNLFQFLKRKRERRTQKIEDLKIKDEFNKKKQEIRAKTAEEIYCAALKEEMGTIDLLGSPDIESKTVKLEDAFVSFRISESWRSHSPSEPYKEMLKVEKGRHLTPEEVIKQAFKNHRLLLVIGDPGSGKTTLLKFYAMRCLDRKTSKYRQLGFKEEILPIYFPLRGLYFGNENDEPVPLQENLARRSEKNHSYISAKQYKNWLQKRKTLVMLDGLDEISNKKQRQKACRWIKNIYTGLNNALFVVTSRATGYRKLDGIEFEMPHLRADIMDFSPQQQEDFLRKWFRAVFLSQLPPEDIPEFEWEQLQEKRAELRAQTITEFLRKKENKAIQELATVPMLLQIMAIIWKDRQHLPKTRPALYDAALNYMLEYRDRQKEIEPVLSAEEARRVLAPSALWMHETLQKDEAPKEEMHEFMQPILNTFESQPRALSFCENLRDRAGLIADYDRNHYIFRHKSFREFLVGIQLKEDSHLSNRLKTLIEHFKEDWWEEALRFFMSKSNDKIFDRFICLFFQSKVSRQLDDNQQTLLQLLVKDAPQKKINGLVDCLKSDSLNNNQRRYVIDCLKSIGTPMAFEAIENTDKSKLDKSNQAYSADIIAETSARQELLSKKSEPTDLFLQPSFRNPIEGNVEYIKVTGGVYKFSVSKKVEIIPDLYFCKYPVTNIRYNQFISFLGGGEKLLELYLPLDMFAEKLLKFSGSIKGYTEYLGENPKEWQVKFRSKYDTDRHFTGGYQPVVGVSWYAARAYCFWLSCLEAGIKGDKRLDSINQLASIYRLPIEKEWEWAAGGEPNGSVREYPWAKEAGEPTPNFANYNENVGKTTPVGRYPDGETPAGLMDMAGNVFEWMENYFDTEKKEKEFALRGGSWLFRAHYLRCTSRYNGLPPYGFNNFGFRVVRAQP